MAVSTKTFIFQFGKGNINGFIFVIVVLAGVVQYLITMDEGEVR